MRSRKRGVGERRRWWWGWSHRIYRRVVLHPREDLLCSSAPPLSSSSSSTESAGCDTMLLLTPARPRSPPAPPQHLLSTCDEAGDERDEELGDGLLAEEGEEGVDGGGERVEDEELDHSEENLPGQQEGEPLVETAEEPLLVDDPSCRERQKRTRAGVVEGREAPATARAPVPTDTETGDSRRGSAGCRPDQCEEGGGGRGEKGEG
eukprot:763467-Hanusia_phi.AAC.2